MGPTVLSAQNSPRSTSVLLEHLITLHQRRVKVNIKCHCFGNVINLFICHLTKCVNFSEECFDCPGGNYCETPGLVLPTGDCAAGYYCTLGASTSTPTDGLTGNVCPLGHYCEVGSTDGKRN